MRSKKPQMVYCSGAYCTKQDTCRRYTERGIRDWRIMTLPLPEAGRDHKGHPQTFDGCDTYLEVKTSK